MKRAIQEETSDSPTDNKLAKYSSHDEDVNNRIGREKLLLSNDVIGLIYSFLPFDEIQKHCLQLVSHQWYESLLLGDFRFALINRVENYLVQEFNLISNSNESTSKKEKERNMIGLLVSVKHWLFARQYVISGFGKNKRKKSFSEWLTRLLSENISSTTYPKIRITKMEKLFREGEELVVLMIYLNEQATLKMSALYSINEDIIIYVDVVKGHCDFKWKERLNIDPNVKRNIVLQVNAKGFEDADCEIEEYQINDKFYDSLYEELKTPKQMHKLSPFNSFLWSEYEDEREKENPKPIVDVEFNRDIEIHDERSNYLIDLYDLENIKETRVLDLAWKVACRAFTSIKSQQIQKKDSEISVSNVIGRILTINFNRKPRLCVDLTFDITYKKSSAKAKLFVQQQFYYGHDGYESDALFRINTQDPIFDYLKLWRIYVGEDQISWESMNYRCQSKEEKDSVSQCRPLLRSILRQLLDIAPHYNVLDKQLISDPRDLLLFHL